MMKFFRKYAIKTACGLDGFIFAKEPSDTGNRIIFDSSHMYVGRVKNGVELNDGINFYSDNTWEGGGEEKGLLKFYNKNSVSYFPKGINGGIELMITSGQNIELKLSDNKRHKSCCFEFAIPKFTLNFEFLNLDLNYTFSDPKHKMLHDLYVNAVTYTDDDFSFEHQRLGKPCFSSVKDPIKRKDFYKSCQDIIEIFKPLKICAFDDFCSIKDKNEKIDIHYSYYDANTIYIGKKKIELENKIITMYEDKDKDENLYIDLELQYHNFLNEKKGRKKLL